MKQENEFVIIKLGKPLYYDINGSPRYHLPLSLLNSECEVSREYQHQIDSYNGFMNSLNYLECQQCGESFIVENSHPVYTSINTKHYGDPPNHCCIGDTMNVVEQRQLNFQEKLKFMKDAKKYHKKFGIKKLISN